MPPNSKEHESLCRRCGVSCHYAVPINGLGVVIDELHCRYLSGDATAGYGCTVYERRFEVAPWCATVDEALQDGLLAQDCPYAADIPGWRGKNRLHRRLMDKVRPAVREHLLKVGVPIGVSHEGLRRFLALTGGDAFDFVEAPGGARLQLIPRRPDT